MAIVPAGLAIAEAPRVPDQCKADERVLYSCAFRRSIGSLCADRDSVHYRFGPRGRPDIDLASLPDWSNVHAGLVRGQGTGHQSHIRLTRGRFHYVVFEGTDGSLADRPGRSYSGIAVLEGANGEQERATLKCTGTATVRLDDAEVIGRAASEEPGGPFDMWY